MEIKSTIEVGRTHDGIPLYRHRFLNKNEMDSFTKAHTYFTKEERKIAKLNHKNQLR